MLDRIEEYLVVILRAFVDSLEDFFSVITYPTRKIIETAFFICCGIIFLSVVLMFMGKPTIISWQEGVSGLALLLIIYLADFITMKDVNRFKSLAERNVNKIAKVMKPVQKKQVKKRK